MRFLFTIIIATILSLSAKAQHGYVETLRKKGKVILKQDKAIDLLVNGNIVEKQPVRTPQKPTATHGSSPNSTQSKHNTPAESKSDNIHPPKLTNSHPPISNATSAEIKKTDVAYRMTQGYRIKIFTGGNTREDREMARNVGKSFKSRFPHIPVYMHFVSPHWICTAGDFPTRDEAQEFLNNTRHEGATASFSGMTIVKSQIKVPATD